MPPKPKGRTTRSQSRREKDPLGALQSAIGSRNTRGNTMKRKAIEELALRLEVGEGGGIATAQQKRVAKKAAADAIRKMNMQEMQAKAPKQAGSRKIMNKKGDRMDFTGDFRAAFWRSHGDEVCAKCNQAIAENERSIDHKKPWSDEKGQLTQHTVCKDNFHWLVVYEDDALELYQTVSNLQPTHKICNSSKGGKKGRDSLSPQKAGHCPGNCTCTKAT